MSRKARRQTGYKKFRVNAEYDYKLIICTVLLAGFGIIILYSSSYYSQGMKLMAKQAVFTLISMTLMFIIAELDYHIFTKRIVIYHLLATISLGLVLTPIGINLNGARRWIGIGPFSFQPAEMVKFTLILAVAGFVTVFRNKLGKMTYEVFLAAIVFAPVIVTYKITDDLSSAVIMLAIGMGMVLIAHPKDKWIIAIGIILLIVAVIAVHIELQQPYDPTGDGSFRINRIRIWLDPFNELYRENDQIVQGLYGISTGGIFGRGLGNSILKKGFLSAPYNDMIFSVLCEELGLFGAGIVLYLFLYLIIRIFRIAISAPDRLGFFICTGVMLHISSQVILNVLVVTNTIPNTGITLCFFSAGLTSLLFLYMELGLVLSVARRIQNLK